jgi:hypothetical protein
MNMWPHFSRPPVRMARCAKTMRLAFVSLQSLTLPHRHGLVQHFVARHYGGAGQGTASAWPLLIEKLARLGDGAVLPTGSGALVWALLGGMMGLGLHKWRARLGPPRLVAPRHTQRLRARVALIGMKKVFRRGPPAEMPPL